MMILIRDLMRKSIYIPIQTVIVQPTREVVQNRVEFGEVNISGCQELEEDPRALCLGHYSKPVVDRVLTGTTLNILQYCDM